MIAKRAIFIENTNAMKRKTIDLTPKPFEIERTEKLTELEKKWSDYAANYYATDADVQVAQLLPHLDDFSRMMWYVFAECGSVRKVAKFLNITEYKATMGVRMMRNNIKAIYKQLNK
jgi:hypothetical protein